MCVVGMLWQDALLDHEPEAQHDEEGGEDGEEEDVELDETVPE